MSEAVVKNVIRYKETIVVTKDDYLEKVRNPIPDLTIKSKTRYPIYVHVIGEGIHGLSAPGEKGWAEVMNICVEIEAPIPRIQGLLNKLRFLLGGQIYDS